MAALSPLGSGESLGSARASCDPGLNDVTLISFLRGGRHAWVLVLWPGIEPRPSAVRALGPKHWIAREFPADFL